MEIREKARERDEIRFFAMNVLRSAIDWIKTSNPENWIEWKKTTPISEDELKAKMRDWINRASDLIEKTWELPGLLVDDAIRVLKEVIGADKRDSSESK